MKKISAVIPTIGRVEYLDLTIQSVLNQELLFDELIVYDNSIEQNLQKLSKFSNTEQVRWQRSYLHKKDPLDSWNSAIKTCTYDYVTVIGDDDLLLSNYCLEAKKMIDLYDLVFMKPIMINELGEVKSSLPFPSADNLTSNEFRYSRLRKEISTYLPGSVFKKSIFEKVGGFQNVNIPGYFFPDDLLYVKMAQVVKKVGLSPRISWQYRYHANQIGSVKSIQNYTRKAREYIDIYESALIKLGVHPKEIYPSHFTQKNYYDYICSVGILNYVNMNLLKDNKLRFVILKEIQKEFYRKNGLTLKSKVKLLIIVLMKLFARTYIGKKIKDLLVK